MAYAWDGRPRADRRERVGHAPTAHALGHETARPSARATARGAIPAFPEIDCLRHRIPPGTLIAAERRAAALGIGADEVLVCGDVISAEQYGRELASFLHLRFESLDTVPRHCCPLPDMRLSEAVAAGILLLRMGGRDILVTAPQGLAARRLVGAYAGRADRSRDVWVTSRDCLQRFVRRHAYAAMVGDAANALRLEKPALSAAPRRKHFRWILFAFVSAVCAGAVFAAATMVAAAQFAMTALFLGWSALRLLGLSSPAPPSARIGRLPDDILPVYTIIVALYREAAALPGLARALRAFDYPVEKLDIKIVLEADDIQTLKIAQELQLGHPFEFIVAPAIGPRTKPKALNVALQLAHGRFTAVYDAEDRPEPDQLRRALAAFAAGGTSLACVQARLTIDNTRDSWLTRLFTAEYAGLFDVLLPALCLFRLPIPLGGSSNHFRTEVLRETGAWDPYNVTEDADLGIRLARRGYTAGMIASTTYEEAPARTWPWVKQRTRWFKGWIQTWCVHMRRPWQLWREIGPFGFFAFQFMLFGTVLAALLHPVGLVMMVIWAGTGTPLFGNEALGWAHAAALLSGYMVSIALGIMGLKRRRLLSTSWVLLLMPLHWLLLSFAGWRALFQFCFDRYSWEKTEHGQARTSRRAKQLALPLRLVMTGRGVN